MSTTHKLAIVAEDSWLSPYENHIQQRMDRLDQKLSEITQNHKSLLNYARWDKYIGLHTDPTTNEWVLREWAPEAKSISLIGDFNSWDRQSHLFERDNNGIWQLKLSKNTLEHGQSIKLCITGADNSTHDRIPSCINRVIQDPESHDFSAQIWNPEKTYQWQYDLTESTSAQKEAPRIYEAHIGIAGEEPKVHNFKHFTKEIIPRIAKAGYNYIQLMAIAEHPYYGSFGYHVSNFFAVSSRFGTPEELKELIDTAHKYKIRILFDIVHSHCVKNISEGLNKFDGTDYQYFHSGEKGNHPDWDSKLFDYSKENVQRFLLSNIRYWIEEFHIDGFRFDGVTSMLYDHHGSTSFDHYDKYFIHGVDEDAILYLQLATKLVREIKPECLLIAEDMSGMPGLARTIEDGGLGFDYRLAMGIPDFWIKLLKHCRDEELNMDLIWSTLANRRIHEKNISYAESHDQALVGDKTLAFWLMDKEMYTHMDLNSESSVIDRGIALHKIIRLLTLFLGGEGWLNFIGNEFGHPEWLDFPREGNSWSFHHCRRQWALVDHPELRYQHLSNFDQALMQFAKESGILSSGHAEQLYVQNEQKIIAAKRNGLVLITNLHPNQSYPDLSIPVHQDGDHKIILDTDREEFGGFGRIGSKTNYPSLGHPTEIKLYLPSRTCVILKKQGINYFEKKGG